MLLLAVTNHMTADVAAIPLLWLLPLCLYLLTFTLAFARRAFYRRALFLPALLLALPALAWVRTHTDYIDLRLAVGLLSAGLFVACMALHGELARRRPPPARLTEYYLFVALGGALGGLLVGVAAPLTLRSTFEFDGAIVAAALLVPLAVALDPAVRARWATPRRRALALVVVGLWAAGLLGFLVVSGSTAMRRAHLAVRSFYGALRVIDHGAPDEDDAVRKLKHGEIVHGAEWRDPKRAGEPLTYYCPDSGVALALALAHPAGGASGRRVGAIGLGIGTLAAYVERGDRMRFYEIDPLVERIARREFHYLATARGEVEVVLGDARLSLEAESANRFDLIAVDAFAGDAIPVHLLTREAFALYARHLAPGGLLAVHVSNRYLNLAPVVADGAHAIGRVAIVVESDDSPDEDSGFCFESRWVVVMPEADAESSVAAWKGSHRLAPRPGLRAWTDEYSNLLAVLK